MNNLTQNGTMHTMSNERQQTAVEWLVEQIMARQLYTKEMLEEFEQAKEMEKKQHEITYNQSLMSNFQTFNDYYDSTYGGNK